jgi:hypothetical protein
MLYTTPDVQYRKNYVSLKKKKKKCKDLRRVNVVYKLWCVGRWCVSERYKNVEDMRRMNIVYKL